MNYVPFFMIICFCVQEFQLVCAQQKKQVHSSNLREAITSTNYSQFKALLQSGASIADPLSARSPRPIFGAAPKISPVLYTLSLYQETSITDEKVKLMAMMKDLLCAGADLLEFETKIEQTPELKIDLNVQQMLQEIRKEEVEVTQSVSVSIPESVLELVDGPINQSILLDLARIQLEEDLGTSSSDEDGRK